MAPESHSQRQLNVVIVLATLFCASVISNILPAAASNSAEKIGVSSANSNSVPNLVTRPPNSESNSASSDASVSKQVTASSEESHQHPLDQVIDTLGTLNANRTNTSDTNHSSESQVPKKKPEAADEGNGMDAVLSLSEKPVVKPVGNHGSYFFNVPEWMSDSYTMSIVLPVSVGVAAAAALLLLVVCFRCLRRCVKRRCCRRVIKTTPITNLKIPDRMKLLSETSDEEF